MAFQTLGWDPMKDAFSNPEFNKYDQGPGGELDDDLQPGALAKSGHSSKRIALHLRDVPKELGEMGIRNFCSKFGKILDVKRFSSSAIVSCSNLSEAENIMRSINEGKQFNIICTFARSNNSNNNHANNDNAFKFGTVNQDQESPYIPEINMRTRKIKGPFNAPIKIATTPADPIVTEDDYRLDDKLLKNDRLKDFCDETLTKFRSEDIMNSNNVFHGIAYYRKDDQLLHQMKKQSIASNGHYNSTNNKYNYPSDDDMDFPTNGPCAVCKIQTNQTCQRCGEFYCSRLCQKKDWPTHRPVCFPLPDLVSSTSNAIARQTNDAFPRQPNAGNQFNSENTASRKKICDRLVQMQPTQAQHANKSTSSSFGATYPTPSSLNQDSQNKNNHSQNYQHNRSQRSARQDKPHARQDQPHARQDQQSSRQDQPSSRQDQLSSRQDQPISRQNQPSLKQDQPNSKQDQPSSRQDQPTSKQDKTMGSSKSSLSETDDRTNQSTSSSKPVLELAPIPKANSLVTITAVKNHQTFFIRSFDDNDEYVQTLNEIAKYALVAANLTILPEKGDIILAKFEEDYYRALVLKRIDSNSINVAFIDYGNIETKTLNELKELPKSLQEKKRYTFKVILHEVPAILKNIKTMEYLHGLVEKAQRLKLTYTGEFGHGNQTLDLFDITNHESVTKYIINQDKIPEAKTSDEILFLSDLKQTKIQGENVEVFVVDNSLIQHGFVSLVKCSDIEELSKNNTRFQEYCEKNKASYTPRANEICLVKYDEDNTWYRAQCIEVVGDGHPSVIFIDFGNHDTVKIENIRKMPREFAFPCLTVFANIKDLPNPIPDKLGARLTELIPSNELTTVAKCEMVPDSEECEIYLPKIIEQLKDEKLM